MDIFKILFNSSFGCLNNMTRCLTCSIILQNNVLESKDKHEFKLRKKKTFKLKIK